MKLLTRLQHAWNAFLEKDEFYDKIYNDKNFYIGNSSTINPYRVILSRGNERSIITAVYNRIAIDCASIKIKHVQLDDNDRYISDVDSYLNQCLTETANKDQTSRAFIQDAVMTLLDEGCIAIVPIDATTNPIYSESYDIKSMRIGRIMQWYPDFVDVEVYNDRKGIREQFKLPKYCVAIVENPLYSITNSPNSTLQRLIRKLNILDAIDEQSGSGKLDLIIQLPYIIKTETRKRQAEQRKQDIERQLSTSKYGIAYTDGTEHITQLNRSVDNNLMKQIEYLTSMLYSQLGITQNVLDGTADEKTMLNYMNRTVEPLVSAIVDAMDVKFLSKTARTQKKRIKFFNDPFRLIPVTNLADIVDKFTRNEVMSTNEVRQIIGMKPVDNPMADELRNKNINAQESQQFASTRDAYSSGNLQEQAPQKQTTVSQMVENVTDLLNNGGNQNG